MPTYYVDTTSGDNGDNGTTEGLAWATLTYADTQIAAGDLVYVKGSADYTETFTLSVAGTSALSIVYEGYTTTPGDGGMVTIDGESSRAYGVYDNNVDDWDYRTFKNIIVENCTSHGWFILYPRFQFFINCESNSNGGRGWSGAPYSSWFECYTSSNSDRGFYVAQSPCMVACKTTADLYGVQAASTPGTMLWCLISGATSTGVYTANAQQPLAMIGCTMDGNAKDTANGVNLAGAYSKAILINNIIYDCGTGITTDASLNLSQQVGRNNLLNSNTSNYSTWDNTDTDVTGAPNFTDEAGGDYTIAADSAAKSAGYDLSGTSSPGADIGAHQSPDTVVITG